MRIESFTEARNGLNAVVNSVVSDVDTTVIIRHDSEDVVVGRVHSKEQVLDRLRAARS
ncbi:hypothetical protein [Vibrio sp. MA40-2]|uniref:hypothetical protein n=1 Tax=Vibrio sp. MA40-2 TaxID=3391828 RepID=UPI0039A4EDBB